MITRLKLSTVEQGLPKYRSMLAGNTAFVPAFESIATTIVGSGGAADVTFSSIPSIYTHLQIRINGRGEGTGNRAPVLVRFNSDSGNNYYWHQIQATGAAVAAEAAPSTTNYARFGSSHIPLDDAGANIFGVVVADILDYANTNKYKVSRSLAGQDQNNSNGRLGLVSSLWLSTSAITSISLYVEGVDWKEGSHLALYGIKGV